MTAPGAGSSQFSGSSMHFFNEKEGLSLGRGGVLLATSDGGNSWIGQRLVEEDNLEFRFNKILFLDDSIGFILGDKIYKTTNGGNTWIAKTSEESEGFSSIHFSDNLKGFAVGENSVFARTTDGGDTWLVERIGTPDTVDGINFVTQSNGWAIWDDCLFATTSGGLRWTRVELPDKGESSVIDVDVLANGSAWAISADGKIWGKASNSTEWNAQESGSSEELTKIQFINETDGWVVGANGTVLYTTDGGVTWQSRQSGTDAYLSGVRFLDRDTGWVSGVNTLLRTVNGGKSWESRLPESTDGFARFYVLNREVAFQTIVFPGDDVFYALRTDDGGESWIEVDSIAATNFHFFNECMGIAMGEAVSITRDAGKSWDQVTPNLSGWTAFDFVSDSIGYLIGDAGRLRKVTVEFAAESVVGTFATDIDAIFPMTLTFDTEVGKDYIVEYSVDMTNWEGGCDRITATATTTQWTEDNWSPESFADSGRYYRVLRIDE